MAMLPEGFKSHSTQGTYERSESYGSVESRGPPPKHNADGYKQDFSGISAESAAYSPDLRDAAKGSETVKGDKNEVQGDRQTTLAIKEPAVYSRDWSGK
jgi:hypothetical protein